MGDHLRMEESGNPEWDGRQNHSPLAEVQYPPKQHGQHARPSTSPSPDMMDSTSPLSPLARTAQFEEDNRTRAERMADHREQNALLQARNMHVRDFFLENMRSERDRRNRQVSRDRSEKREMWNQRLRNRGEAAESNARPGESRSQDNKCREAHHRSSQGKAAGSTEQADAQETAIATRATSLASAAHIPAGVDSACTHTIVAG